MTTRIVVCLVTYVALCEASKGDFFLTRNQTPLTTGGLVIKNLQGETVKELADVPSDFNESPH